jgi:peptidyl-prolyl cis-trans isomerase B (cyclophilin B)
MTCSQSRRQRSRRLERFLACALVGFGTVACAVQAASGAPFDGIEARIDAVQKTVNPGNPVRVRFAVHNHTDDPFVLAVPGVTPQPADVIAELPLTHVFGSTGHGALTVRGDYGRTRNTLTGYREPTEALEIVLGPHAFVGCEINLLDYLPELRSPGNYRLRWQPYGGLVLSNEIIIKVARLKQAEIVTDGGAMTVAFYYDLAPNHVANFIELAQNGFYAQKTFHRVEPGFFMQGGCPNRDGTGIRTDGKKLNAEFNDAKIDRGTLVMARLEDDPNSASCQFIITDARLPGWDGKYTAFGHLIGEESYATLANLMDREVDPETGKPKRSIYIRGVRIFDAPVANELSPPVQAEPPATIDLATPIVEQVPDLIDHTPQQTEEVPAMIEIAPRATQAKPEKIESAPRVMKLAPPATKRAPAKPQSTPAPAEKIIEMESVPVESEHKKVDRDRTPAIIDSGDDEEFIEMYVAEPEPGDPD